MSEVRHIDDNRDCRIKEVLASATLAATQMIAAKLLQFAMKWALREGVLVPSFCSMSEFPTTCGACVTVFRPSPWRAHRRALGATGLRRWLAERLGLMRAQPAARAVFP